MPISRQRGELVGVVEARDGKMSFCRLQVLPDGHDVALDRSQVMHDRTRLVRRFAHADDQAGLGRHAHLFGSAQQLD